VEHDVLRTGANAGLLGFFQVERLVVEEDGEASVSIWKE